MHGAMVRWMITVLIRLAPDMPNLDHPDGVHISEEVTLTSGSSILAEATSEAITQKAEELKAWFSRLTKLIVSCVKDIVISTAANQNTASPSPASASSAKQSLKDLEKFQVSPLNNCKLFNKFCTQLNSFTSGLKCVFVSTF